MIGKAIYYLLSNDATVSGLVGTKIYPERTPEAKPFPFIIYNTNSDDPSDTKDGVSTLDQINQDVLSFASTMNEAESIDLAIRNVLDRYSGNANGVDIDSIRFLTTRSGYDDNAKVYFKETTYKFRIRL